MRPADWVAYAALALLTSVLMSFVVITLATPPCPTEGSDGRIVCVMG